MLCQMWWIPKVPGKGGYQWKIQHTHHWERRTELIWYINMVTTIFLRLCIFGVVWETGFICRLLGYNSYFEMAYNMDCIYLLTVSVFGILPSIWFQVTWGRNTTFQMIFWISLIVLWGGLSADNLATFCGDVIWGDAWCGSQSYLFIRVCRTCGVGLAVLFPITNKKARWWILTVFCGWFCWIPLSPWSCMPGALLSVGGGSYISGPVVGSQLIFEFSKRKLIYASSADGIKILESLKVLIWRNFAEGFDLPFCFPNNPWPPPNCKFWIFIDMAHHHGWW